MRVLVTGANGFVGRWLVQHLTAEGDEVQQLFGPAAPADAGVTTDLRDAERVHSIVERSRPDAVYHLAAVSFGPDAAGDVEHAVAVTVMGTANVLEASRALDPSPVVLVVSSSEVYAPLPGRAIVESDQVFPSTTYGATKLAQEAIGLAYHRTGRLEVAIARPFNHIGPGQRPEFVVSGFARQLAEIVAGRREAVVAVGNLAAIRDFTDVRDVVRAYRLIVMSTMRGRPINIASGRGIAISDLLDRLIAVSRARVSIQVDESRFRPLDVPSVVGDANLLSQATGWRPEIEIEESVQTIWADATARFGAH